MRLWILLLACSCLQAMDLAIIIDDLGYNPALGRRTLALPGPITVAILPGTPFAESLAMLADEQAIETMLHLPMANKAGFPLGPFGLELDMSHEERLKLARQALATLPNVRGFNNHQGSLLTEDAAAMAFLFAHLPASDLYFVDSLTTANSKAGAQADAHGWLWGQRHIFLDHQASQDFVRQQMQLTWQRLEQHGHALVIGHPYVETLTVLEQMLPHWQEQGVRLLPVSSYLALHGQQGESSVPGSDHKDEPKQLLPSLENPPSAQTDPLAPRQQPFWPRLLEH